MKTRSLLPPASVCAALCLAAGPLTSPASAQDVPPPATGVVPATGAVPATRVDSAQLLREALFEEQGLRDLDKAAATYEKVVAAYDAERALAATALFRLAEVRRGQNKNDHAAFLYQRLLTEFPDHNPLARLSRENLAALGVKEIPGAPAAAPDGQDAKIAELQRMLKNSPDLVTAKGPTSPLSSAAREGHTKVVKFLLDAGAKSDDSILTIAAGNGHLGVCETLISHGANVKESLALNEAAGKGRLEVARLLLEKGADPDFRPKDSVGNPLFSAVLNGKPEVIDLLLKAKASPELTAPSQSPLFHAVRSGDTALTKRLLGLGADIHSRCVELVPGSPQDCTTTGTNRGLTVLHAAVMNPNPETLDFLLASGAVADLEAVNNNGVTPLALAVSNGGVDIAARLLKAGANPNVELQDGAPLMVWAAISPNAGPLVRLLLDAGADAKALAGGRNALSFLAGGGEESLPVIRMLAAAGVDPAGGEQPLLENAKGSTAVALVREFSYPKWAALPQVTLSFPELHLSGALAVPAAPSAGNPSPLGELMLEWDLGNLSGWKEKPGVISTRLQWDTLRLHRRDAAGKLEERILIKWAEELPALKWGDILEFTSGTELTATNGSHPAPGNLPIRGRRILPSPPAEVLKLPEEISTRLQSLITRHVTVTLNGKSWPMTLRGGLKVYNPLKPEAPLTDAVTLMKMMGADGPQWLKASVKVTRQPEEGGGEITTSISRGSVVPLKEGDALELTGEPINPTRNGSGVSAGFTGEAYLSGTILVSPGLPFSKMVENSFGSPTLIQFLAAAWPPVSSSSLEKLKVTHPETGGKPGPDQPVPLELGNEGIQAILPHPDCSRITIRRIGNNGEMEEIPVNLTTAITACTDATTPEEARKADVELLQADTVVIPILEDRRNQTWTGFDEATNRFFSKALASQITLTDDDGSFRALNVSYRPVQFQETQAGLLGFPSDSSPPNGLNVFSIPTLVELADPGKYWKWLQRAGSPDREGPDSTFPHKWLWLRPGDTIGITNKQSAPSVIGRPRNNGAPAVPRYNVGIPEN